MYYSTGPANTHGTDTADMRHAGGLLKDINSYDLHVNGSIAPEHMDDPAGTDIVDVRRHPGRMVPGTGFHAPGGDPPGLHIRHTMANIDTHQPPEHEHDAIINDPVGTTMDFLRRLPGRIVPGLEAMSGHRGLPAPCNHITLLKTCARAPLHGETTLKHARMTTAARRTMS